jgi:hypothetical protein
MFGFGGYCLDLTGGKTVRFFSANGKNVVLAARTGEPGTFLRLGAVC